MDRVDQDRDEDRDKDEDELGGCMLVLMYTARPQRRRSLSDKGQRHPRYRPRSICQSILAQLQSRKEKPTVRKEIEISTGGGVLVGQNREDVA